MHLVYLLVRTYPYWAVPIAIVFGQLAIHYMRQLNPIRFLFWMITAALVFLAFAWIFFRGDLHSDEWVRSFFS